MDIREKIKRLQDLYGQFEAEAQPYLASAVCAPGCADCCTNVGSVDATTLEGWVILRHLQSCPTARQKDFARRLKQNRKMKMESKYARCAFLEKDNRCGIYAVRPFSCRRLYSIRKCGETGPTVHRQAWELAESTVTAIQSLDDTGYSGHISYVLQLLNDTAFRKVYLDDLFSPEAIRDYARSHDLVINRFANLSSSPAPR